MKKFLDGEAIPTEGWTPALHEEIPEVKHSIVKEFFRNSQKKRHFTDGYAFSKTKTIETSRKLLPGCNNLSELLSHTAIIRQREYALHLN